MFREELIFYKNTNNNKTGKTTLKVNLKHLKQKTSHRKGCLQGTENNLEGVIAALLKSNWG